MEPQTEYLCVTSVIELETPQFRVDGLPGFVFYDDNYDVMTYAARSSDTTHSGVIVRQSDERLQGRPTLFYRTLPTARPSSTATIVLTANDGRGGTSSLFFRIFIPQQCTTGGRCPSSALFPERTSCTTTATAMMPTSVESSVSVPLPHSTLSPNPTSESSVLRYTLAQPGRVRAELYSALGARVAVLFEEQRGSGTHEHIFDTSPLSTGMYVVRFVIAGSAANPPQSLMLRVVR